MHVPVTKKLTDRQRARLSEPQREKWDRVTLRYENASEHRGKVSERLHNVKIKAHLAATRPDNPNWRQREVLLVQLEQELEAARAEETEARDQYHALLVELGDVIGPA